MLAPILFNIYVQCITRLLAASLDAQSLIAIHYRTDRSLFDLKKLKAKTKISKTLLLEFQYADDCPLVADSPEKLQLILTRIDTLYQRLGLSINVQKTELIKYIPHDTEATVELNIHQEPLKEVTSFKYLGSHITANCTLDDEVNFRIGRASSAYGRFRIRVFEN